MSFTRFHDDPCRIVKQNQQMTDQSRYILDVPGNGSKPCYMEDPQIIPQKWGANVYTNHVDIQSNLLGLNHKPSKRDCFSETTYGLGKYSNPIKASNSNRIEYPSCDMLTTEQSRVTNPAWMYKDLEQVDWYFLPLDPQENVFLPFQHNLNTRVLEKDYFQRPMECPLNQTEGSVPSQYTIPTYTGGPLTCSGSNSCSKI
jgi:hypothetical protein